MGTLCDGLGVHIWLSLVCPKLEAGQKLRSLLANQILDIWGQFVTKGIVWLPGMVVRDSGRTSYKSDS